MKKNYLPKCVLFSAVGLAALMSSSTAAHAQSIDYASLETLFGEPVTTSATGKPQRVSEAPVAMEILTSDDIRRSGAKDIAEVLRTLSGVHVIQATRQQYDIGIRGYNQNYSPNLLVLVNGRQVYYDNYGYTVWPTIPVQMSEIRQIEVVKGPNTALFGFNAANGVINIVTINPIYDDVSKFTVTGGTGNYRDGSVIHTARFFDNKLGIRLSGGASKADEFDSEKNGLDPSTVFTKPERSSLNLDTLVQLTSKSQFRVEASGSRVHGTEMTPFGFMTKAEHATHSVKGTLMADTDFGRIEATSYKNWLDTNFMGSLYAPTLTSDVRNNVWVSQLSDTFKVGVSHTFRIQGEYRHNVVNGGVIGPKGSSVQNDVYGLSAMWEWAINKSWDWTNSARVDRLQLSRRGPLTPGIFLTDEDFDRDITRPSFNSGLVWKATPDDTFRLSAAHGVRMASFFDFALSLNAGGTIDVDGPGGFPPFPVIQVGNPTLNPTTVTSYELGWDRKIKAIDGNFKINTFMTQTSHLMGGTNVICTPLAAPCNAAQFVTQADNVGHSQSYGVELGLNGKIGKNWKWGISNTTQKIVDRYDARDDYNTEDLTPLNMTSVHVGFQEGKWEADAFAYYSTSFKQQEPGPSIAVQPPYVSAPAHFSVSGRVAYKLNKNTTIAVSGQELQASHSQASLAPDLERRVFLSIDKEF